MRQQFAPPPDRDMLTDEAERADDHIIRELGAGMHDRCRMNLHAQPPSDE
jgi:hypothetical protein